MITPCFHKHSRRCIVCRQYDQGKVEHAKNEKDVGDENDENDEKEETAVCNGIIARAFSFLFFYVFVACVQANTCPL